MILGSAAVLSSVLTGARAESKKSAAGTGQRGMKSEAEALNVKRRVKSAPPEQQSSAQDQSKSIDEASAHTQSVPLLTKQNAPDIPQCREILNQAILDLVNSASEDPAETFEKNRLAHPHSIMLPPPLDCASKLWMAARRNSSAAESADYAMSPEFLSLGQKSTETFSNQGSLNASVGTNTNPAGGIEGYQGTGSISIDPNNPLHIIASSNTFYKDPISTCQSPTGGTANTYGTIALFGSTDGGATWTYNCAPWPATLTGGVTGATFWFGSYPTLAWDNQGRAYVSYLLISQSASAYGAAIVVARSSDQGASWQSLGTVVNGIASTTQGNDKEMMAIDNTSGQAFSHSGRLYVIWQAANAEKIAFSDNGTSWTTVNFPSNTGAGGGNVVVGADGAVYVIWSRYNVETIVFSKSTDGGATWTAPQVIATLALQSYGANNKPPAQDKRGVNGFGAIDVDRNPASSSFGNLYVSFSDFPSGTTTGADLNTYVIRSTNGGTSWSSRVKVNDDNFGATQMFPWLAVDQSDGTVNVFWYDTRLDPLNRKTQAVYARSIDGGTSFEPNIPVSDGGANWKNNVNYSDENSADNAAYNSNQYGDYSGVAALNRQAHPLWTDSRMFFPVADSQSPTRREDNATATITNCSTPSSIAAPAVNPSTTPNVAVSWSAPAGWGTNATTGTYSVFRNTSAVFPSGSPVASDLTSTNYVDTTGNSGTTYYYFIRAKNNCPGTVLTPMSTDSAASVAVTFGSNGTPTGTLQGTVMAGALPVGGVTVTAGTLSATTNASGFYWLAAIAPSTFTVSAGLAGYNPESVNGVVVTGGGTTVQDLSLSPILSGSCFTDTTYADFVTGAGSNLDIAGNPGDVKLRNLGVEASDQISSPAALSTTNNLSATTWTGQTFRAGVTGNLTKMNLGLGLASGTSGTITVEIRNLNGTIPGTTVLASTTAGPVTNVGTASLYTLTFATPAAVVSGTSYAIVLRTSVGSTVFGVRGSTAGGSSMANGQVFTTTNSGTAWTPVAADLYFTTYVTPPLAYPLSGNLFSAVKDANPVVGLIPRWLTLSWNATTPANTTVQFQVAASNNVNGPFNFVGPDGTAATFFTTSGASLAQFNDFRYLKYQAFLSTTDNVITPTLTDVTVCFDNDTPLIAAAAPLSRQQGSGFINEQIAIVSDPGQAANTLIVTATPLTGTGVSINNINVGPPGHVTADVAASGTATNSTFTLKVTNNASVTVTQTLTVNVTAVATPTITPGGPTTFCAGDSVTLTSSSASGNQWYLNGTPISGATNQGYVATAAGGYTVTVTTSTPSTTTTVTVNPLPATPTITPGGPTTFCTAGSVNLTSSSASGNQWYLNGTPIDGATNQVYTANSTGDYTVMDTNSGCSSAPSAATTVTVNPTPATPTITPGGPTTFAAGGSVTLTSSSASGNQWYLNGNPVGGDQAYIATAAGDYTLVITASGCASSPSAATTVTVNPTPPTPTITPGGPTTFCTGGSVTLTSSSASGNQWYLNGNPIGGATDQQCIVNASGDYTHTVTTNGSTSAASTATTVTVNPIPATPTITPSGPTTFTAGGSVTLTSSGAGGNQWYRNGHLLGGATNQGYIVNSTGDYTVTNTASGCSSTASTATTVTVNPIPGTPTITPGGESTFCAGGSVTLTSSSVDGNQWYLNGNPISGATAQQHNAATSGDYTLTVTTSGATSAPSAATAVIANTAPTLTYPTQHTLTFGLSLNITPTAASDNGTVTYQVLAGHGLATTPTVNSSGVVSITNAQPAGAHSITIRVTDDCGATTDAAFTLQIPSPANVSGSKMVSGTFAPVSTVTYSIVLSNNSGAPQLDNAGNEFTDVLSSSLTLVSANASSGSAMATVGTNTVAWNGSIAGSGSVTITIAATIKNVPDATTVSNQGMISYDADGNGTNEASRVTDDPSKAGASDPTSFTVGDVNDPPDAVDDTLTSVAENSGMRTIAISSLLANDTDGPPNESGQTFALTSVSNPVGGTVSSDATNVYFTPVADFNGTASFQYTVTDNGTTNGVADPKSDTATVSFSITEGNGAPTAVNDALGNMEEDAPQRTIPFSVLTNNDSKGAANESSQTLIVKTVSNAVGLTVSIVGGTVRFQPLPDYNGPASFKYTTEDDGTTNGLPDPKTSGQALVHFNITEVNDAPTAVNDTLANAEYSRQRTISFADLTGNDTKGPVNESGQTLIVKTVTNAVGGTVSIVSGDVLFALTANYFGPASFQYTVEDNGTTKGVADPKTSGAATVTLPRSAMAATPSVTNATTNANTQTTSGLVISRNAADGTEVTDFKIAGINGGSLFKNNGTTQITNGDFITFAEGNAGLKFTPGMTNGSFTVQASTSASDAGLSSLDGGTALATITVNPMGGVIRFSAANYSVAEGAGFKTITVERSGDTSQAVTVDYATSDQSDPPDLISCSAPGVGFASSRCDFTTAIGTLRFAAGETLKSFNVLIGNDNYVEGPEMLTLKLSNPSAGSVFGVPAEATLQITDNATASATNPIDNSSDFVRALYHDMLNREPDGPGLVFWTDNIEKCNDAARRSADQTVAQCIDKQRESTAIGFFMSPEFQMTGGFVYRLYKGSLTGAPNYDGGLLQSSGRFPMSVEFVQDMSQVSEGIVVNNQLSGAVVEANRNRLAAEFVQRAEFVAKYGGLNNTLYVQELFNTTRTTTATTGERQALVDGLTNGTETRAGVLMKVVDGTVVTNAGDVQFATPYGQAFINQENGRLFVYMEYVGYLRRNPDAAGFVFWLGKLNFFNGDPFQAEMVRSFILSPEYRSRFGQP
jgi:hypothetical protein